ncbi:MAG: NYN domain-containing protein [Thermotogae bacterium]|nr:NYN domain-containing protein [Thermotogota bacterium]
MIKVGAFADVENVVATFQNLNQEVRFDEILRFLRDQLRKEGKVLWKAVAFVPLKKGDRRREGLISALSFQGWRVITKMARRQPSGTLKANMDMEMAIELLQTSDYLDEVVLITGDGDFIPLIDLLSKKGKRVWVIGTRKGSVALELIRAGDRYMNIVDIQDYLDDNGEPYKVLRFHPKTYAPEASKEEEMEEGAEHGREGEEEGGYYLGDVPDYSREGEDEVS